MYRFVHRSDDPSGARSYGVRTRFPKEKNEREVGKMADYARIYGISTWNHDQIKGHAEDYIRLGEDCYISESDYEFLEEILEKENE